MSDEAKTAREVIERLKSHDPTLKHINLSFAHPSREIMTEVIDCMIDHPDGATKVSLDGNWLTDEMGVNVARYVASSSTIEHLTLFVNALYLPSFLAMAAALHINCSLRTLSMFSNNPEYKRRIDAAFIDALRLNTNRPPDSEWSIYDIAPQYPGYDSLARQLGAPSMLSQLSACENWHEKNKFRNLCF